MKLEKMCFGLFKNIYLCAKYIAPGNSPLCTLSEDGQDKHDQLSNDIDIYSALGGVAVIGDLNSRCGLHQEIIHNDIDIDSRNGNRAQPAYLNLRNNSDLNVSRHGRKLLQIMTNYDMLLSNGRICGDMTGNYTCCQYNGSSVVDVSIAQRQSLPLISYFKVLSFDW